MKEKNKRHPRQKYWRWLKKIIAIGTLLLICNPLTIFVGVMLIKEVAGDRHDSIILERFAAPLFDYPLPSDTTEIDRELKIVYAGSTGYCIFYARRIVHSLLPEEDLIHHFADLKLPSAHERNRLISIEGGIIGKDPVSIKLEVEAENQYSLIATDGAYKAGRYINQGCK